MSRPAVISERTGNDVASAPPMTSNPAEARREGFRCRLREHPPSGLGAEELEAHCSSMPEHYWERVTEADLVWGLTAVHGFLKLMASPNVPATTPYIEARQAVEGGRTRVMLCTWDRRGLLAKAAAAFSALRLSILEAEAFTRSDNIVLDVFSVVDLESSGPATEARLKETFFLVEGALSEPPRFASVWMCSRHKYLVSPGPALPRITFDNRSSEQSTILRLEAPDRLGLLYDLLQALADEGLDVSQAHITTEGTLARDTVYFRDADGQKVLAADRLTQLRLKLRQAVMLSGR
jgi:[protein-PII] uridylyltransferase